MPLKEKAPAITSAALMTLTLSGCFPLSGGWEGFLNNMMPAPNPDSPAITRQRTTLVKNIEATFDALDMRTGFAKHATSSHDRCYHSQSDWKIRSTYAHSCRFRITRFYGVTGDFPERMIEFEALLGANEWKLPAVTLREMMTSDYYASLRINNPRMVLHAPRPAEGYKKGNLVLQVVYAEKSINNLSSMDFAQHVAFEAIYQTHDRKHETYAREKLQDVRVVSGAITRSYDYVLAVSIQGTYFEE
jgi:hypothetical protein